MIRVNADDAKTFYNMQSWVGDAGFLWSAAWWYGFERAQPGFASGSQAQEAWHKQFKRYIKTMYLRIPDFVERLRGYCDILKGQVTINDPDLPDMPHEPWPDDLLLNSEAMFRLGRTSALDYHKLGAYAVWEDRSPGHTTTYFAMRRRLLVWDERTQTMVKAVEVKDVPAASAKLMAQLIKANTADGVSMALRALGASAPLGEDMVSLYRTVSRYVVAIVGDQVQQHWRMVVPDSVGAQAHCSALCGFCDEAALHSTCEHIYTGFLHMDLIQAETCDMPQYKRGRKKPDRAAV